MSAYKVWIHIERNNVALAEAAGDFGYNEDEDEEFEDEGPARGGRRVRHP